MCESLGKQLKDKRTKAGYTLDQIAELSKIPIATLIAIEAGDNGPLPAKPFARGFVRTYAKLVGLDPDRAVALFDQEAPDSTPKSPSTSTPPNLIVEPRAEEKESILWFQASRTFFMLIGIIVTIALSGVIFVALEKVQSYNDEKTTDEEVLQEVPKALEEEIFVTPSLPQDTELSQVDENKEEPVKVAADSQGSDSPAAAQPKKEAKTETAVKVTAPPLKKKTAATSHKISVQALQDVELTIVWSIGPPQAFPLKPNEIKNIIFSSSVTIRISNGSAVKILYDGQLVDHSKQQQPVELNYP